MKLSAAAAAKSKSGEAMSKDIKSSHGYLDALNQAKQLIVQSQEKFLRTANRISMEVRLNLGKIIDEHTVKYDWGKSVL